MLLKVCEGTTEQLTKPAFFKDICSMFRIKNTISCASSTISDSSGGILDPQALIGLLRTALDQFAQNLTHYLRWLNSMAARLYNANTPRPAEFNDAAKVIFTFVCTTSLMKPYTQEMLKKAPQAEEVVPIEVENLTTPEFSEKMREIDEYSSTMTRHYETACKACNVRR